MPTVSQMEADLTSLTPDQGVFCFTFCGHISVVRP
jgi:hypothetical protein